MASSADVFREKLRLYREQRQLSQGDLAEKAGISPSYVSELEIGRRIPTLATMDKLATALGIRPFQFLYEGTDDEAILLKTFAETMLKTGTDLVLQSFAPYKTKER